MSLNLNSKQKRLIKSSLTAFRSIILANDEARELEPAPFHYELSDLLLKEKHNIALEMFRESGKSSYVLRAFPLYALSFPKKELSFIVIIKQSQRSASAKLRDLVNEYQANHILRHNLMRIKEQSMNAFSADVLNEKGEEINIRIEAYGKGSSIRGLSSQDRRPNIVILDDIQDKEDSRSETILSQDWDWFLSDIVFLGRHSRVFIIGNNLGDKCVIEKCIANADNLNFKAMKIPVMINGKPTWEAKEPLSLILKERENYEKMGKLDVWQQEKMCVAVSEETRIFKEDDYRYYSNSAIPELLKNGSVFATLDPASSSNPESCYRAVVVMAVDRNNNWFIIDVKYGRWDSAGMIDIIFKIVRDYRLRDFHIEKGWYEQVIKPFLMQEMKRRNIFFNVIPLEHAKAGTKLERIKMLQPHFKAHSVFFPDYADWLTEMKTELAGVTKDAIKSEYIDIVDALAMMEQIAEAPIGRGASYARILSRGTEYEQSKTVFDLSGF